MIKRIAVTGPESTGKSSLARELALRFNTVCTEESARKYLDHLKRPYTYDDLLVIAREQYQQNESATAKANKILFCDTELIVMKIWCEFKYGKCHPWINENLAKQSFDLYLLTNIDLPWQPDPQREHPKQRRTLFQMYFDVLSSSSLPFKVISGTGEERINNAIEVIQNLE